jgi:hypothetical protein
MEPDLPPLEELELIRQKLTQQIAEAEQMFSVERNGHELLTSKAALKYIEEAIRSARERKVA